VNLLAIAVRRVARTLLLLLVVAAGATALVRFGPGFLSDEREMDAKYAEGARSEMEAQAAGDQSAGAIMAREVKGWLNGDLGESRQFQVPVTELIAPRIEVSALLLARGILYGWLLALCTAVPASAMRRGRLLWDLPFTLLLATPTAAMATVCILAGAGGPVLVLTLLIAARDFKFLSRILRQAWSSPHLLQGRAQGLGLTRLMLLHILPNVAHRLRALATLSIVTALAATIPIEVIFTVPGIGQLAWSAVMNRDLPVVVAVSLLMAAVVALASMFSAGARTLETA
jgi:peptide/nickel transport system permease protein